MLDLSMPVESLTAALVDIESVSGDEAGLADLVERALRAYPNLSVERDGNVVLARTDLGLDQRVVLAGHLDTVPIANNVPSRVEEGRLFGCGTSDMKSGVAVLLRVAHLVGTGELTPRVDLTWICYDCEEIEAARNGLGRVARERPEVLAADLAVLLEPTDGVIEGGCQGTLRVVVSTTGTRAHSARSWLGSNAIHAAAPILATLAAYEAREAEVDGLHYREGLNAVGIRGGVAGNVVPDGCEVTVNFRFAPDRSESEALAHVQEVFAGFAVRLTDSAPGARPGLDAALPRAIVEAVGAPARAKLGWTDVALFGRLGIPAVNLGPGDPNLAHKVDESVDVEIIGQTERALVRFLS
ncbi:succinyl-diaminopimelate desuccinylase [Jatrophihabitans sp.]|uniref:succinyl-diaminopimelate desuccinylase n=1 Tax=Jatrophihabitans sp. TaxID=1932789 RepID=UPI0030C6FE97|nr:dapE [Jatrophihabitans sp.]